MLENRDWISLPGFVDPPEPPEGFCTEVKRDAMFGFVTHYRHLPLQKESGMNKAQITHMVNRFLAWKLPDDFNPDGGIAFDKWARTATPGFVVQREPVGTNLLSAVQAEAMIRHMLEGLPAQ
ncbi:hypothetical protein [Rhizobium sp. 12,4]|uniref:hypothetical protein n=1 Tax=Rhizobium sp. 12,4 TaxID=3405135 RepID=UPI003D358E7F